MADDERDLTESVLPDTDDAPADDDDDNFGQLSRWDLQNAGEQAEEPPSPS